jgi:large subunit ribosomal protein L30
MSKVKIIQIKSSIGKPKRQKDTLIALGLARIGKSVEKELTPQIEGMISKINHLVIVEEI